MSFLLETVLQHAAARPNATALEGPAGQSLGWSALAAAITAEQQRLGATLTDGQRPVAIQADHSVAHCLTDLALMETGVPVLSLPTFFSAAQKTHALSESGAQALLHDGVAGLTAEWLQPATVGAALPAGTARISYTSGSSGAPTGICLSTAHLLAVAHAVARTVGPDHVGRHLALLPPGLLLENVAGFYATLLAGGTYIALPQTQVGLSNPFAPDFRTMARAIALTRATSIILVPEYLAGLVTWLESSGQRLRRLTLVAAGGASVTAQWLERAAAVGLPVRQGYGLTECGSVVCLHDGGSEALGSVGRSLGAHRLTLAADGEILVDGPGHLGTVGAARTATTWQTGDIGRFDSAGNLWISGRKSNVIITSFGRNISPEWIEGLLTGQPAIAQAMVFGDDAAQLSALIVARGTEAAAVADIAAVNAQLPEYARVRGWFLVAPFTTANGLLTGNGRLRRQEIHRRYLTPETADAIL
jgi:long-subunit acyl-CoA synthetase (AMP-forming)